MKLIRQEWVVKLNNLCGRWIMPLMLIALILYSTIVNDLLNGKIETLQNILAIIVLCIVGINILAKPMVDILKWGKQNIFILGYFIVRLITIVLTNFDYSTIRSVFFEAFFLIGIMGDVVKIRPIEQYVKIFLGFEVILTTCSVVLYYGSIVFGFEDSLASWTNIELQQVALLFGNINAAGIMSGFAIIVSIIYYKKDIFNDKLLIVLGAYNTLLLILFGCRSSQIGIIVVVAMCIVIRCFKSVDIKKMATIILACAVALLVPIYGCIMYVGEYDSYELSKEEHLINDMSTGRYAIWKQCAITQGKDTLFGKGSLKLEKEARQDLLEGLDLDYYWRMEKAASLGPHNGYIALISCTGVIGFVLFISAIFEKMKNSKLDSNNKWSLVLIFIFVINCFESLFILNRFFTTFFMFLLLESEFEQEKGFF